MSNPRASVADRPPKDPSQFLYSVVVPVYNSEPIVGRTIEAIIDFFEGKGWRFELVLVNDGSSDGSWPIIQDAAEQDSRVIAINLLKNYGQHSANLCGFRQTSGDYVITMDDDLQNPPSEIRHLVEKAVLGGHDVVFGRFDKKKAPWYRAAGSRVIAMINRRVFAQPAGLTVSNFRILDRKVVDRICNSRSAFPYITGQALLFSSNRANVDVHQDPRPEGKSNYNAFKIASLVTRVLFSYSIAPLRIIALIGAAIAVLSFGFGVVFLIRGLTTGAGVQGWTSTVALLSFLNGTIILMLSMLGEYLVRTLNQVSEYQPYYVTESVNADRDADVG
jgi:glycosyltransferase involved in cell wall biosynthesis